MAYWRMARMTGDGEQPAGTWLYACDTESDVTTDIPDECVALLVLEPEEDKSAARVRNSIGEWKEVG